MGRVCLTGGLGHYLNLEKAQALGLFSGFDAARVVRMGNAALTGCRQLLFDNNRGQLAVIGAKTEFCALETKKEFQDIFCEQLLLCG